MRLFVLTLLAFTAALGNARPADDLFSFAVDADGVRVNLVKKSEVATHHLDRDLLIFMTMDGQLFATDVRLRPDGTLPPPETVHVADLGAAMGDLTWWTALIGTMNAEQARAQDHLKVGDIVIGKQDLEGPHLVTIISRADLLDEIDCLRALSYN